MRGFIGNLKIMITLDSQAQLELLRSPKKIKKLTIGRNHQGCF